MIKAHFISKILKTLKLVIFKCLQVEIVISICISLKILMLLHYHESLNFRRFFIEVK